MIQNKNYFVDRIDYNVSKPFTQCYHNSNTSSKVPILNLGIFKRDTEKLVGVMQLINTDTSLDVLNRYTIDKIGKANFFEITRFCMADSEPCNAESQGISLCLKWIKEYVPAVRILIAFSGRQEGNYGYIYQATNWKYVGYFIQNKYVYVNGQEKYFSTLYKNLRKKPEFKNYQGMHLLDALCEVYADVRKYEAKQFIYIMPFDTSIKLSRPVLNYPKPDNEYPIIVSKTIYKENNDIFQNQISTYFPDPEYYYTKDTKYYFKTGKGKNKKVLGFVSPSPYTGQAVAVYDITGELIAKFPSVARVDLPDTPTHGIRTSLQTKFRFKDKYFRFYNKELGDPPPRIPVPGICIINGKIFKSCAEIANFCNCNLEEAERARVRRKKTINNYKVKWI